MATVATILSVAFVVLQPLGVMLTGYMGTFSAYLQSYLNINGAEMGMFTSLPLFICIPVILVVGSQAQRIGLQKLIITLGVLHSSSAALIIAGYFIKGPRLMLFGQCVLVPANFLLDTTYSALLVEHLDSETYASLSGWVQAFGSIGVLMNQFVLPVCDEKIVVLTYLTAALLITLICVWSGIRTSCSNKDQSMQDDAIEPSCCQMCRAYSWKFWLLIVFSAFTGGLYSIICYGPYHVEQLDHYSLSGANAVVASASAAGIIFGPPAGWLFAHYKSLRGPLFVAGAILSEVGSLMDERLLALNVTLWVHHGVGFTILKTGTFGLLPEAISGQEKSMSTANSIMWVTYLGLQTVVSQTLYSLPTTPIFENAYNVLTAPKIFTNIYGIILIILSVALWCAMPLASTSTPTTSKSDESNECDV